MFVVVMMVVVVAVVVVVVVRMVVYCLFVSVVCSLGIVLLLVVIAF